MARNKELLPAPLSPAKTIYVKRDICMSKETGVTSVVKGLLPAPLFALPKETHIREKRHMHVKKDADLSKVL